MSQRAYDLKRKYNITVEIYNAMLEEQDGVCAICGFESDRQLAVDHNHETGEVRGLLCSSCNRGLGMFRDSVHNLTKAKSYLKSRGGKLRRSVSLSKAMEDEGKVILQNPPKDGLGGHTEPLVNQTGYTKDGFTYSPPEIYASGVIRPGREAKYANHTNTQNDEMDRREAYRAAYRKDALNPDVSQEVKTMEQLKLWA